MLHTSKRDLLNRNVKIHWNFLSNADRFESIDDATYDLLCVMLHIGSLKSKKKHYRKSKGGTLNMCKAFEDWSKEERIKGEKIGSKRGEQKAFTLMSKLIQDNRLEEARRVADNAALRKKLYLEYGI